MPEGVGVWAIRWASHSEFWGCRMSLYDFLIECLHSGSLIVNPILHFSHHSLSSIIFCDITQTDRQIHQLPGKKRSKTIQRFMCLCLIQYPILWIKFYIPQKCFYFFTRLDRQIFLTIPSSKFKKKITMQNCTTDWNEFSWRWPHFLRIIYHDKTRKNGPISSGCDTYTHCYLYH